MTDGNVEQSEKKRLDQYKRFFQPTLADNQEDYYSPIRPILGSELSVAFIEKEDMLSYIRMSYAIQEMFANGQDDLGLLLETSMTGELKLSMSREGLVVENIFSNKMEYTTTENVHQYQHMQDKKKGLLGGVLKGKKE